MMTMVRELSARESEVLALIALGKTNPQIAQHMRDANGDPLSTHTVGQYVRRAFQKLGVQSRAAAVARWMAERHAAEVERIVERKLAEPSEEGRI